MSTSAAYVPSNAVTQEKLSWFSSGMAVVWAIALGKFALHMYFNNQYGYFRDEFDYIACGNHLAWGYVDQPPLIPFLIRVCRFVLGDSLRSIRFVPALASALLDQRSRLEQLFGSVQYVGTSPDNPYALESEIPVWICRVPKFGTLAQLWPQIKKWS